MVTSLDIDENQLENYLSEVYKKENFVLQNGDKTTRMLIDKYGWSPKKAYDELEKAYRHGLADKIIGVKVNGVKINVYRPKKGKK